MRDRLIELLEQIAGQTDDDACRDCDGDCVRCAYENVADHLLANGVIVQPICSECVFDDGLNWYQCERCVGGKINVFVSIEEDGNADR